MARTPTRNTTRKREARKAVYVPPDVLDIDQDIKDFFAAKGQHLRWVRWSLDGREDGKNLRRKAREGWEPVMKDEIPVEFHGDFEFGEGRLEGTIVNGDVALYKIPVDLSEARQDYYEGVAIDLGDATNRRLMKYSNRKMPISNQSQSRTTVGRKPAEIGALGADEQD